MKASEVVMKKKIIDIFQPMKFESILLKPVQDLSDETKFTERINAICSFIAAY